MIDIIDPNLNLPQQSTAAPVEPVEPIKSETVGIEEERLEDERERERNRQEQKERLRKDKVEISGLKDAEEEETDGSLPSSTASSDGEEHTIDVVI